MRMLADATCPRRRMATLFAYLALVLTVVALAMLFLAPPASLAGMAGPATLTGPAVSPANLNVIPAAGSAGHAERERSRRRAFSEGAGIAIATIISVR